MLTVPLLAAVTAYEPVDAWDAVPDDVSKTASGSTGGVPGSRTNRAVRVNANIIPMSTAILNGFVYGIAYLLVLPAIARMYQREKEY